MRILYYVPHPTLRSDSPSGYGTHIRSMIRAFVELGHEVEPVVMGDDGAAPRAASGPAPRSRASRLRPFVPEALWNTLKGARLLRFDRSAAARLREAIDRFRPDLVYERAAYLQTSGVDTCRTLGVPHLLEVNSPNAEEARELGGRSLLLGRGERAERRQLEGTGRIAIVSTALRDHLADAHGVPRSKFVVTPNAIFPGDYAEAVTARRPAGVSEDAAVVGFVGSIFPWHGIDALIDAFGSVEVPGRDCHLVIVGDGAPVPALRDRATGAGLGSRVHFTGSVGHEEVRSWLAGMDVAVMPRSNWYGSPVKIFEYGAMGLPIVATRNGPIAEVLTDGEDGILVDDGLEALGTALTRLLADPALAQGMGSSFQAKVLSTHTWTHNAEAALNGHPDLAPGA